MMEQVLMEQRQLQMDLIMESMQQAIATIVETNKQIQTDMADMGAILGEMVELCNK